MTRPLSPSLSPSPSLPPSFPPSPSSPSPSTLLFHASYASFLSFSFFSFSFYSSVPCLLHFFSLWQPLATNSAEKKSQHAWEKTPEKKKVVLSLGGSGSLSGDHHPDFARDAKLGRSLVGAMDGRMMSCGARFCLSMWCSFLSEG